MNFLLSLLLLAAAMAAPSLQPQKQSLLVRASSLFSGGIAGTVASTITCPLEVVKTQLQSSNVDSSSGVRSVVKSIYKADGVPGFWRGLPPTLVGIIPSRATYFYAYSCAKSFLKPWVGEGDVNAILSGAAAGITGNTITNPIWMVKTRMQLLPKEGGGQIVYTGYRNAVKTIFREEGLGGFYRGISASYWGCTEGCIQFVLYERVKTKLLHRENKRRAALKLPPTDTLPKSTYFFSAAFSKCLATITTYPHEVARTRMREQATAGVFKYNGMIRTLRTIGAEEGRKGLYAGIGTHTARVVPNSAIMFLAYEVVNEWIRRRERS